jgi:hypothetical protein
MAKIGLIYLLRAQNGLVPVQTFVESYRRNSGGADHELVVLLKGCKNAKEVAFYENLFSGFNFRKMLVSDDGFDIRPYFKAVEHFEFSRFCFLNSFSVLLDEQWLAKLQAQLDERQIGAVGATGSWESLYSNIVQEAQWHLKRSVGLRLLRPFRLIIAKQWFPPFPNYHLRTNAVLSTKELLQKIVVPPLRFKLDAMRFETGFRGFTRQIEAMGKKVLVVGRNGQAYEKTEWKRSQTYRHGQQENLLVADNRTRLYAQSQLPEQKQLACLAWGSV